MNSPSINVIKCDSVSVRCNDGEIFGFKVVDNKDMFPLFFRKNNNYDYCLQCLYVAKAYALYKKHKNIYYLICVWSEKEELNTEALEIIHADESLHYLLK
ncbi:hypothetical protein [Pantoea ananatis]|uniref:hypothetical protein n=1 Tax=Pantoea ananas TaxID=553 RepID=UPI00235015F4|nr:hypothetical protein [Pantoea ananatis]MDC7862241.1 hypothetical protein [Pantoea ananatis]